MLKLWILTALNVTFQAAKCYFEATDISDRLSVSFRFFLERQCGEGRAIAIGVDLREVRCRRVGKMHFAALRWLIDARLVDDKQYDTALEKSLEMFVWAAQAQDEEVMAESRATREDLSETR